MALQVWLPLDGDLRNQGLDDSVTVTNNGTIIDNNGKIGKCYSFNGSSYIDTGYKESIGTGDFSISAWIYITQTSGKTYQCIVGNKGSGATSVGFALYWNQNQKKFLWSTADGSASTEIWSIDTFDTIIYNSWHHIVMCRNNNDSKKGYFYLDGIRKEIASIPAIRNITSINSIKIGSVMPTSAAYYFTGKINDVRIYDHALSAKEVKELSKGLILHYRLSKPIPNLLQNGAFTSLTTGNTGLGTGIYATSWGGYNGGISNPTANYHACIDNTTFNYPVYMYNETNGSRNWKGISQTISKSYIEGSTEYMFSCDVYQTLSGGKIWGGFYYKKTGASSANFASGSFNISASMIPTNKWTTISIKVPFNNDIDSSATTVSFYIYGYGFSDNGIVYIKNVKLEKGIRATTFIPNEADALYSALGYNSNTELDCAPANNHNDGTIVGTITAAADSPRYETSYYFNGTSYFKTTSPFGEIRTVSLWAKWDSIPSGQSIIFVDYKSYFGLGLYSGGILCGSRSNVKAFSKANLVANTWYHFVIIAPNGGSNAERKLYINGQEQTALTATSNWSYSIDELQVGKRSSTNDGFKGNISDFRIYCTALSAEDILELYNTAAQIDKDGNIYSYEFEENNNQNITKTGIMSGGLLEDTTIAKINKNDISLTTGGNNITIQAPIEGNGFYEY